jgi:predicted ATP-grasp superfamily ATP-dependent carboligase
MMSPGRILVTDGETRAAVAAARGLADAGFDVVAAAGSWPAAAHWSRSVAARIRIPDPLADEAASMAVLARAAARGDISALMPGSDASLLNISRSREMLPAHVCLGLPSHPAVQRCLDKSELATLATRHALDPPETAVCTSPEQALAAAEEMGFPVVVKPLSSIIETATPRRRAGSQLVTNRYQLGRVLAGFGGHGLIQRQVHGTVLSFAGVFAGGRLLAEALSRYHRTWHPAAGNACYSETMAAPRTLRERVVSLLEELGWEGLFELELIEAGLAWHAIDLNPRPYGSLALAIGAGANLPAIWCQHLLGHTPSPVTADPGTLYRWTDADLRHGLWQLRAGHGFRATKVLGVRRGVVHPYVRGLDVGPGLARMLELGRQEAGGRRRRRARSRGRAPVVVLGAGPNGLAVAAHLREFGIETVCFGEPLESWASHMPAGMRLRSRRRSSHIADPQRALTIDDYERAAGRRLPTGGLTLEEFIDYGRWFQQHAVPGLDTRKATEVARDDGDFRVRLQDGEALRASRVIVATGLSPFMNCPAPFAALPRSLRSHAYEHSSLSGFTGKRVAVIGAGQSALECAALLSETGATVEVVARADSIRWLGDGSDTEAPPAVRRRGIAVSPPPTDVGGRVTGWVAATPDLFRHLPGRLQPTISVRCIRPAAAGWLRPRLTGVQISCGRGVIEATAEGGEAKLRLTDGSSRAVDHVLLGTGYQVDVRRYPFLARDLVAQLRVAGGYPVLGPGLESSVARLHFMGAPAAHSFGPIMRFVVGSWYSAPAIARSAAERRQPPVSFSF